MNEHYAFVLMTKEKYLTKFRERSQEGRKTHSFVLRGAAPPKDAHILFFYVANPEKALDGYAEFIERKTGTPEEVWNEYGNESVLESKAGFDEFIGNPQQVTFIRFKNLKTAVNPVSLENLRMLRGVKMLSRKGYYVNKDMAEKFISMME
jgi:predicted transcriptional regulator